MPIETITVHEAQGTTTITTRQGDRVVVDEEHRTLTLQDVNGNKLELGPGGITITSIGDITFRAAGNVGVRATGDVATIADGAISQRGKTIAHQAREGFTAQAANAQLVADGETIIRGALVRIN